MENRKKRRRRERLIEQIATGIMFVLLIILLVMLVVQIREINELQEKINGTQVNVVRAEDFLPEGFTIQDAAYQAACQRYDVEQGYVIPEQNETAPKAATSEAVDAQK